MDLCCEKLQEYVANAGGAGVSIVARIIADEYVFVLQSRACSLSEEPLLKNAAMETAKTHPIQAKLRISTQQAIFYCPHCGTSLREQANNDREAFKALTNQHREFLI